MGRNQENVNCWIIAAIAFVIPFVVRFTSWSIGFRQIAKHYQLARPIEVLVSLILVVLMLCLMPNKFADR